MKRSIRVAGVTILGLLLAAGAALWLAPSRVSSLLVDVFGIEKAAEELLTQAVGTKVAIASIDVALIEGEMTIRGLTVANPEGFRTEHAFEADEVRIAVELGTLLEDAVVIREIAVEKPLVTYELGPDGSNLEAIQQNVESAAGSGEASSRDAPTRQILVEDLYIRGGRVAASAVFLKEKAWKAPLPDIHLENISSTGGGIAAADVIEEITSEILANARRSIAPIRELAGEVGDRITAGAGKVLERVKRELEKGSGPARETLERGSGAGDAGARVGHHRPRDREEEGRGRSRGARQGSRVGGEGVGGGSRFHPGSPREGDRVGPRGPREGNGQGQEDAGPAPREARGLSRGGCALRRPRGAGRSAARPGRKRPRYKRNAAGRNAS